MTDNPTPNDIALLREAFRAECHCAGDLPPQTYVVTADAFERAVRRALASGQHDGAAGQQFAENAKIPEGMVARECGYNHPQGTRCPACADWPYKKGGAAAYMGSLAPKPSTEQVRAEGASKTVWRIAQFMGEQGEREAVVGWLRKIGDSKPHGTDWRTYYEIADAIEVETHIAATPSGADALGDRL